jgi:hypothetical protein
VNGPTDLATGCLSTAYFLSSVTSCASRTSGAFSLPYRARAFIFSAMTASERHARRATTWKDRAGAAAAAWGVGFFGLTICHEQIRSFRYAYTMSAAVGVVMGLVTYRVMMRIMRRLP